MALTLSKELKKLNSDFIINNYDEILLEKFQLYRYEYDYVYENEELKEMNLINTRDFEEIELELLVKLQDYRIRKNKICNDYLDHCTKTKKKLAMK